LMACPAKYDRPFRQTMRFALAAILGAQGPACG
jgi:hypothetical protein